ncbi:MAG: hypothetical protein HY909_28730 [Deltaproteobacteria bacterium]|nr:hypothetical protein [Deltaproteobacteria bacterium]
MNPVAYFIQAWFGVALGVGLVFLTLGRVKRAGTEYTVFGAMALAVALFELATARVYTTGAPEALRWECARVCAAAAFGALSLDLARLLGARTRFFTRATLAGYLYAAVAVGAIAAGWALSPPAVLRRFAVGSWLFVWQENTLRPAGAAVLLGLPVLSGVASLGYASLVRAGRPWCRPIAGAYGAVVLAALWDVATGIAEAPAPYLSEHVLLAFVSVTAYALLERLLDELSARTAELRALDGVLTAVRQTLAEREHLALVGELSAIVAHEVRNPLAVIRNATSSLQKPDRPANERLLLFSIIDEECDRLNRLVTDLLTLARPISPQLRMVDIPELLDRSLEPARRADTEVDVRYDLSGEEPLYCDAQLLRHALENLIENAVQAMGTRGTLVVTVTRKAHPEGSDREFAVIDSGEGMNTEVRNNARRPFFTTRTSGTGLGLAIVERIVTAHNGALDIESKRGRGTTVRVRIPEQRPSVPDPALLA